MVDLADLELVMLDCLVVAGGQWQGRQCNG
jgi:hypothetical protein